MAFIGKPEVTTAHQDAIFSATEDPNAGELEIGHILLLGRTLDYVRKRWIHLPYLRSTF